MMISLDFTNILKSGNPDHVFETMRKVILSDDQLDEKTMVQKLITLMHSYNKIKTDGNMKWT